MINLIEEELKKQQKHNNVYNSLLRQNTLKLNQIIIK